MMRHILAEKKMPRDETIGCLIEIWHANGSDTSKLEKKGNTKSGRLEQLPVFRELKNTHFVMIDNPRYHYRNTATGSDLTN